MSIGMDVLPFNVNERDIQGNVFPLPGGSLENWKKLGKVGWTCVTN
jgi:hypothetical protein